MNNSNEYKLVNNGGNEKQVMLRKTIARDMKAKQDALKSKYSQEYFEFCQSYYANEFEPWFAKDRAFTMSLRDRGIYQ